MVDQFEDYSECGIGMKYVFMGSCVQIHSPYAYLHQEYDLTVEYVEQQLQLKWDYATNNIENDINDLKYDSFFDNSVAFWVNDLSDHYIDWINKLKSSSNIIFLTWYADIDIHKQHMFYSMITHDPNTMIFYELISDTFKISKNIKLKFLESESRAYFINKDYSDYSRYINECIMYPIGSRKAVSDINKNIEFYRSIFKDTIIDESQIITGETVDYMGEIVKYAHIILEKAFHDDITGYDGSPTTISFFQRSEKSTYGELTVKNFEDGMLTLDIFHYVLLSCLVCTQCKDACTKMTTPTINVNVFLFN